MSSREGTEGDRRRGEKKKAKHRDDGAQRAGAVRERRERAKSRSEEEELRWPERRTRVAKKRWSWREKQTAAGVGVDQSRCVEPQRVREAVVLS
jgi:hypothetical protein